MASRTERTAPGWVESRTRREGLPGPLPITLENTSGARLEPPIPNSTTWRTPRRPTRSAKLGQGRVWLGGCQVEPSEPVGELGREGFGRPQRGILLPRAGGRIRLPSQLANCASTAGARSPRASVCAGIEVADTSGDATRGIDLRGAGPRPARVTVSPAIRVNRASRSAPPASRSHQWTAAGQSFPPYIDPMSPQPASGSTGEPVSAAAPAGSR